ncbi:hypothetical protein [Catellatospora paridis]|uniref:hypothetical protein n=1 Tax=Catellatospora paridis TaxID=1617086 RepID=UPI0012D4055A|nr:hypothetical protein [Catellatospora paridis]
MTSIISSLVGALVGGLLTIAATQATIEAQLAAVSAQAEADRMAQIREARGRIYSDFLDGLSGLKSSLRTLQHCVTETFGEPPSRVFLSSVTNAGRDGQPAECERAPRQYMTDRMRVQGIRDHLTVWGSAELYNRASLILPAFPEFDDCVARANAARDKVMTTCSFIYVDMSPLLHLWYVGGLVGKDSSNPPPAIEPTDSTSSDFEKATEAFGSAFGEFDRGDFLMHLVDVGIREIRHQFCKEVAAPGARCEQPSV